MIEVYRGSPNTWECDEMGHMNVRFYVAKMMEGLAGFSHCIEMPHAFKPNSPSTLQPRDQHIRFLREAHPGRPFSMRAGVLEVRDASALIYQQLDHGDGTPCAAYRTWVDHIDTETGRLFSWSARTRAALEAHIVEPPKKLAPKSIDPTAPVRGSATMADADTVGAPVLGNGVVSGDQCDLFGWMKAEMYIARISDAVPNLMAAWRENVAAAARAKGEEVTSGAAVLEYRLRYRKWPKAGDRVQVRSTLGDCTDKILSFVHWVIDPDSGEAWCTTEAVAVTFDLNTRKVITAPPEHMEALRALAPTGLTV